MKNSLKLGMVLALLAATFTFLGGSASADGTFDWGGNGFPNATCTGTPQTMLWIFNDNGSAVPTALFINGQQQTNLFTGDTTWTQSGNGNGSYKFSVQVNGTNYPPNLAGTSVTYTGTLGSSTVLTLSGCNEGLPRLASLNIFKTIPNVLQGSETVTFTFQALIGAPPTVAGSCTITFIAGQTSGQCTITGLQPNTTYTIHEVPQAPWATQPDVQATTGAAGSNTDGPTFTNNFGPATAQACKVTDVDNTGHDASGDTFQFDLLADGVVVETIPVAGGGTPGDPVCESFSTALDEGVTYTIGEQTPPAGWTKDSLVCDVNGVGPVASFTPDYPDDADAQFTCTATNSITAANATVRKVTIPAGNESGFTFHLFADGVEVASVTSTGAGALDFGVDLQDGVHYTVTEDPVAEWESNGGVGCDFIVTYPADSGRTFECVFTNRHVSLGLTPGYWKTHLAPNGSAGCSSLPRGTSCSKNGPWTSQYLPLHLGNYTVTTIGQAAAVFNAMNCSSTTSSINCLAGHLLAAELNVANGASSCANDFIADANTFLSGGSVDGVTGVNYTGPGTYTTTSAQRAKAIELKTALDTYNNGTCP